MTAGIDLHPTEVGRVVVTRPSGRLSAATYPDLRDGLLKLVADEPEGLVVVLDHLAVTETTALSVFSTVWLRVSDWPGVPLALVAGRDPVRSLLAASAVPRFVPTFDALLPALDSLGRPAPRRRREVALADAGAGRAARRIARESCLAWGVPDVASDAAVVASELAENAERHARPGPRWLRLELRRDMLTVAVADADPTPARVRPPDDPAPGGRGLLLVDDAARTWGQAPRLDGGKVVWAVVRVPGSGR